MSEVNFTCLIADLENVCTALMTLAQEGHMTAGEYNAFNGQIFYIEETVQEIQEALECECITTDMGGVCLHCGSQPRGEE